MTLVCAMGVAQAVHSHPDGSTTSHHACSICTAAHVGLSVGPVMTPPVLIAAALATPASESSDIFRPASTQFIRPPPAL
jgi:hypothetical protein